MWCFIIPSWFVLFRSDSEITGYALDALCNVLSNEPLDDGKKPFFHHIYVFIIFTVHVLFNSSNVKVKEGVSISNQIYEALPHFWVWYQFWVF